MWQWDGFMVGLPQEKKKMMNSMITFPVTNNRVHPRRTLHKKIHVNSAYLWFKIQFSIYSGSTQN
jgi:hypothetical protein